MRIFVAGASGALGQPLVSLLVKAGHTVVGTTRTPSKMNELSGLGAETVIMDALEASSVRAAVASAKPEVVVHQMTAISSMKDFRRVDDEMATTNRLRTEGTERLIDAARAAGTVRHFVAQSYSGWPNARTGSRVKTEADELDLDPPQAMRRTLDAIRRLEALVLAAGDLSGTVLRYGALYGRRTGLAPGGAFYEGIKARRFPVVGGGAGVWSFIHVGDAAVATRLAIDKRAAGLYNVVDDEPAEVREWLPVLAEVIGAPPPRRVPGWLGGILGGDALVSLMTKVRGSSNARAKQALGWRPGYASWREGFRHGLTADTVEVSPPSAHRADAPRVVPP